MSTHDDPTGHATAKLGQAVVVLAAAAEAFAQLAKVRPPPGQPTTNKPRPPARAQLRARHAVDRLTWSPLLDDAPPPCRSRAPSRAGVQPGAGPTTRKRRPPGEPRRNASANCAPRRCASTASRSPPASTRGRRCATPGGCSTGNRPDLPRARRCPSRDRRSRRGRRRPRTTPGRGARPASDRGGNRRGLPGGAVGPAVLPGPLVVDVAAAAVTVAAEGAGQALAANLTPTRPLVR